ncbi:MAG: ABC transporter permease [Clostridia bacterium]|nr:ABC transporter permease [Clostridia bacterium]
MTAIYKKELRSYFTTPLGYVFCAVYLAISGFLFSVLTVHQGTTDISGYFSIMIFGYIVLLPLLTMKSFSEERRARTEQVLMTSPTSVTSIVFAKFLASYTIFAGTLLVSCLYFIPLSKYGTVNGPRTFGCLIAMFLIGLAFTAIGIFVSSLTESTVTAAVGTMAILLVSVSASLFNSLIDSYFVRQILSWISFYGRYQNFTYGFFDYSAALYYVSVTAVFLFLTVRVHERRRWA